MIIQSKNVWLNEHLQPAMIRIAGGIIDKVMPYGSEKADMDFKEHMVLPGFIDIHDHGYHGGDANHATKAFMQSWSSYLPSEGITSFLPTTSTAFKNDLLESYRILGDVIEEGVPGAQILGLHLEGPMISCEFRGSHHPDLIIAPDEALIKEWMTLSKQHIKLITLAPEHDLGFRAVSYCTAHGIAVSIGHSAATYEIAKEAVAHGAASFTHTFNGMKGLHHREAGAAGAAMDLEQAYAEVIADGVHVDYNVVRILGKLKGKDRLIAVTDSIWAKDMPPGVYPKPEKGVDIIIDEHNVVRLATGSLAGSTNKLNQMVCNLVKQAKLPLVTAINSVTANPARLLKVDEQKGFLQEGYDADITIVDQDFHVLSTFVHGEQRYAAAD